MHCAHARFVWNLALDQCEMMRSFDGFADQNMWDRQLTEARKMFPWLAAGSSSAQQAALRDLRQAFRNWWANPGHFGYPTFRRKSGTSGFAVRDLSVQIVNRRWATITIPKAGRVKFRLSRPLPADAKSARVTLDRSGRWHVSFVSPQPEFVRETTGAMVGLDVGVAHTLTTSDGQHFDMPALLSPGEKRRLRLLQRKLARQQKGSNRRACTKRSIARLHARKTDRRKDWIEKVTTQLVSDHDLIVVENLKVANMVKSASGTITEPGTNVAQKRGLNRAISEQAWATIRQRLEDKTKAASVSTTLAAVPAAFTSQRCSKCFHTAKENRDSQAVFGCVKCGFAEHADVNAAINILAAGRAVPGRGGPPIGEPAKRQLSKVAA